jgi:hypothetical protein
VFSFFFLLLF